MDQARISVVNVQRYRKLSRKLQAKYSSVTVKCLENTALKLALLKIPVRLSPSNIKIFSLSDINKYCLSCVCTHVQTEDKNFDAEKDADTAGT